MAQRKRGKRRGGGAGGAIASMITVAVLIAAILGWGRVNNIDSPTAAFDYFREWSDHIHECGGGEAEWNCDTMLPSDGSGSTIGDGDESVDDTEEVTALLTNVQVSDPQEIDYDRSEWRHWTGSPCNTREEVLINQGKNVEQGKNCRITAGEWLDPFTGEVFTNASNLDIDHVIPLGYAARHGGNDWSADRKEEFANDKSNLLAVSASANRSKGDKGPGDYMPDLKEYHCQYSKIWIKTAEKYDLSVTEKDYRALEKGLQTC